jgi:uncharacterized HAD superfamily protein
MKFGFDLDEVVCDLTASLLDLMYVEYGVKHDLNIFSGYNFYDNDYTEDIEINADIAHMLVRAVRDLSVLSNCKPDQRFARLVSFLHTYGFEIHFITARQPEAEEVTRVWLDRHKIPYTSLTVIGYGNNKGPKIKALGLDYFVDDFIENIEAALGYDEKLKGRTFIVDKPWNEAYYNKHVIRARNEKDIINHIMDKRAGGSNVSDR